MPSEERITAIQNTVTSKFDFIETIKISINSLKDIINNVGNAPKLSLNLGASKYTESQHIVILDFSWYKPFKPYGDVVLTGFIYAFFIWRTFIHLPNIIHGLGGTIESDYMVSDINAYNRFGFGRSSSLNLRQSNKGGGIFRR